MENLRILMKKLRPFPHSGQPQNGSSNLLMVAGLVVGSGAYTAHKTNELTKTQKIHRQKVQLMADKKVNEAALDRFSVEVDKARSFNQIPASKTYQIPHERQISSREFTDLYKGQASSENLGLVPVRVAVIEKNRSNKTVLVEVSPLMKDFPSTKQKALFQYQAADPLRPDPPVVSECRNAFGLEDTTQIKYYKFTGKKFKRKKTVINDRYAVVELDVDKKIKKVSFDFIHPEGQYCFASNTRKTIKVDMETHGNAKVLSLGLNSSIKNRRIKLKGNFGKIDLKAKKNKKIGIKGNTGDIDVNSSRVTKALNIEGNTGNINVNSRKRSKKIRVNGNTGDVNVRAGKAVRRVKVSGNNGDVSLQSGERVK